MEPQAPKMDEGERHDADLVPPWDGAPTTKTQPWRLFWPPTPNSDVYDRLLREHPKVLLWQFDVTQPFDRPWRQWTDRFQVEEGIPPSWRCGGSVPHTIPDPDRKEEVEDVRAVRMTLDEQIGALNLPVVQPESFNYLSPLDLYEQEKPYKCQLPGPCFGGSRMNNLASKNYPGIVISNIAGHESLFSLDQSGFEFAKCPIDVKGWSDEAVVSLYLPSLVQWLKQRLGCQDVFCYAYNFRRHGNDRDPWNGLKYAVKPPFFRVHCDSSEAACSERLQLYFPESFRSIMGSRVRFLNIWRPLSSTPVEDCPLALCDFRTVDKADLVPMDIVYPHFVDEAYEVRYNPAHRWFYKKGMRQEDVVVFKLYDNLASEATVCPHSAFVDPSVGLSGARRASIEVKVIAIG